MSNQEIVLLILVLALSVQLTRALPFAIFRQSDSLPRIIGYLGKVLPAAVMGLLCVYCFKDYDFSSLKSFLPALIAAASVVLIHLWKKNTIFSIALGTAVYMLLIRII